MPIISGSSGGGLPSGGATSQVVGYGGSSGKGSWVLPPGYEIGYDQITAPVNVTATTEATSNAIIAGSAHTFDGAPVLAHFFCDRIVMPAETNASSSVQMILSLFESTTQITRLAFVVFQVNATIQNALQVPISAFYRFTPSAGSHTYSVAGMVSVTNGTPNVQAGGGGTAADSPAFLRFTKV